MSDEEFPVIQVDIEPNLQDRMISIYVEERFTPESQQVFRSDTAAGASVADALYHAVFNEMVISILTRQVEEARNAHQPAD